MNSTQSVAKSFQRVLVLTFALMCCRLEAGSGWNIDQFRDWACRREITIPAANVATNLIDFPVLLSITNDVDLRDKVKADAGDILVTLGDETSSVPREIESWDSTNGTLIMWFKAPALSTNTDNVFYMYYGNPTGAETNDARVWDDHFSMVQHLNEFPATGVDPPQGLDSTTNGSDLTVGGMTSNSLVAAAIGNGWEFNGASSRGTTPYNDAIAFGTGDFTLEAWLFRYETGIYNCCMDFRAGGSTNSTTFHWTSSSTFRLNCYEKVHPAGELSSGIGPTGVWIHVVSVFDRDVGAFQYKNGIQVAAEETVEWTGMTAALGWNRGVSVGRRWDYNDRYFLGMMDEVRVSRTRRSPGWIKTCHDNQVDPAAFMSVSAEQRFVCRGTTFLVH